MGAGAGVDSGEEAGGAATGGGARAPRDGRAPTLGVPKVRPRPSGVPKPGRSWLRLMRGDAWASCGGVMSGGAIGGRADSRRLANTGRARRRERHGRLKLLGDQGRDGASLGGLRGSRGGGWLRSLEDALAHGYGALAKGRQDILGRTAGPGGQNAASATKR
jgi:hypothetical protein